MTTNPDDTRPALRQLAIVHPVVRSQCIDHASIKVDALVRKSPNKLKRLLLSLFTCDPVLLARNGYIERLKVLEFCISFNNCDAMMMYRNCSRNLVFSVQPSLE